MSRIARAAAALALSLVVMAPAAAALPRTDFDRLDFSVTLKDVSAAAEGQRQLPPGRIFLLDGTVTDMSFLDKEEASFRVRIELMSGEWIGLEDVKSYSCLVTFAGSEWSRVFPVKASRNPAPGAVVPNARVLVIARPLEITTRPGGARLMSLEGLGVRVLQ
jgi:hypothetical protein